MKKAFWIFVFWTIAILVSLGSGLSPRLALAEERVGFLDSNTEKQHFRSLILADRFCHAIEAQTYITLGNTLPLPTLKQLFFAFAKALEQEYYALFSQYCFYSQNKIIRFKTTDLIFPSHYFW